MAAIKATEFSRVKNELAATESRNQELEERLSRLETMMRGQESRDFPSHQSRNDESRNHEMRSSTLRRSFNMYHKSPFIFHPSEIPPGMEYHWVRESSNGMLDRDRPAEMLMCGWTFVPPSRHPDRCISIPGQPDKTLEGCIKCKDAILMERAKEINDEDRRYWQEETNRTINNLPGLDNLARSPGARLDKVVNKTSQTMSSFREPGLESGYSNSSFGE